MSQSKVKNESGTKATWKASHPAEHGHLDAAQVNHLPETPRQLSNISVSE
jgi:hypothetical protein